MKSPIWVVVATTCGLPPPDELAAHPTTTAQARAAAATAAVRLPGTGSTRASAETANTPPAITDMAAPGGTFATTDSHRPATPSAATSTTEAACQVRIRRVHSRAV